LDEALSVNIARLPLGQIPAALLRDGAPPLYYFLLHFWMQVFGSGDLAVRALSGLFSVATLPALWLAGRQLGGRRAAAWTVLIAASSPFAIRYATEARMYSLVTFLVAWGYLALRKSLKEPTGASLASVAVIAAALALSHYWALYLLFVVALILLAQALRSGSRPARNALIAMAVGGVLFVPWVSRFLYQLHHTGTPWADAPPFGSLITSVTFWAGGPLRTGPLLAVIFLALIVLAIWGRPDPEGVRLVHTARPEAGALALVVFGSLVVAYVAGVVSHSTFADRYTSIVFPLFVVLVASGLLALGSAKVRTGVLTAIVAFSLFNSVGALSLQRTQAGRAAHLILKNAENADVIAYCPDQLGPAVSRILDGKSDHGAGPILSRQFQQLAYPAGASPRFVDWVDYAERNRASDPIEFAHLLETRVPTGGSIWLVSSPGYRTYGSKCSQLKEELASIHPNSETLLRRKPKTKAWEREDLTVFHTP
jgi:hypothetical protein